MTTTTTKAEDKTSPEPVIPDWNTMEWAARTMEPGCYPGMSRADYDAAPGVSHTMLQAFRRGKLTKPTRSTIIGTALHARLEDQDGTIFRERFHCIAEELNLRKKSDKFLMGQLMEKHPGKGILRPSEHEQVRAMFQSLVSTDLGKRYVKHPGQRELAIFARITGNTRNFGPHNTLVKGLIDLDGDDKIWDLKTTFLTNPSEFKQSIFSFKYHTQAACYRELHAATHNGEYKRFSWLCICTQPPFAVFPVEATPEILTAGLDALDMLLTFYERTAK